MFRRVFVQSLCLAFFALGCEKTGEKSVAAAREHVASLQKTVATDVGEVRQGLPEGAKHLASLFDGDKTPADDLPAVRDALEKARSKVQDLRVAKSTFFALVSPSGAVWRNDQEQDLMAGKNMFASFPKLKDALDGKYHEGRGSMPEAARVKGGDGQWVAAQPLVRDGKTVALYVTGWSWSAYAYRLENALRGQVRSDQGSAEDKLPLIYVYVVVGDSAYGAPVSPEVNAKAIVEQKPLGKMQDGIFATALEIAERKFALAVGKTPELGDDVAVAVLRSET
ncbi:MAG: hypothetical protein R3B13_28605 [Polyangiaceae bacterium]